MHKYAALTALAIALNITVLTPALSAGPVGYCGSLSCTCRWECAVQDWRGGIKYSKPSRQACVAQSVTAKEATQH
jgi:hypothetical protein